MSSVIRSNYGKWRLTLYKEIELRKVEYMALENKPLRMSGRIIDYFEYQSEIAWKWEHHHHLEDVGKEWKQEYRLEIGR